jgi:hypothetical protein
MTLYNKTFADFQKSYLGIVPMTIIGQSCLGSAAAMYVLKNGTSLLQVFELALVVIISMSVNAAIISQLKPKTVFNLLIASVILNTFMIVTNTILNR